ncbi:MAG: hypothetical protein U0Y96_05915 [Candidatus Kapaibacterium sp.]|nr:hypothetical protein [Bacteroidota bacterium]
MKTLENALSSLELKTWISDIAIYLMETLNVDISEKIERIYIELRAQNFTAVQAKNAEFWIKFGSWQKYQKSEFKMNLFFPEKEQLEKLTDCGIVCLTKSELQSKIKQYQKEGFTDGKMEERKRYENSMKSFNEDYLSLKKEIERLKAIQADLELQLNRIQHLYPEVFHEIDKQMPTM